MLHSLTGFLADVRGAFSVGMIILRLEERIFQMVWKSEGAISGDQEKFSAHD